MERAIGIVLACVVVAGLLPGTAVAAGPTVASVEREAKELANRARADHGVAPLRWNASLRDVARRHAERMARQAKLRHNPNLRNEVMPYRALGENVGVGPRMSLIHEAFMDSDGHRRNMLAPYALAGFGAAVVGDDVWITQVFLTPR
jgi:uncharacterized protein YkwD